jgi:hypothetical protein
MTGTLTRPASRVATAGWLCAVGALIGAAGGLVLALVTPAVGPDRFSYPLSPDAHRIIEIVFTVNHVLLLVGVLALARTGAAGTGRAGRIGLRVTAAGLVLLTVCEVGAFLLAESANPTGQTDLLGGGFGVSTVLIGVGLLLAGTAVIRERRWSGWARHVVLVCGLAVFVVVIPGLMMSMVAGRLVLVTWMLIWAGLGVALVRAGGRG